MYLAIVIMVVLLGIGLGINALLVDQIKALRGIGDSVIAFYAAEAGVEKILYDDSQGVNIVSICNDPPGDCTGSLSNSASFSVVVTTCAAFNYCVESLGSFKQVQRKISVER